MSLQSLIDKPKELLELIDSCLKPKVSETKNIGKFLHQYVLLSLFSKKLYFFENSDNNTK